MPPGHAAPSSDDVLRQKINDSAVTIIAGDVNGTDIRMVADMAAVLNDGLKLRILPIIGQGSAQTIADILFLRGIDIGIVQSDVLAHLRKSGKFGNRLSRITYITKLHNQELHIIASKKIRAIEDLAGKGVNFGLPGSSSDISARNLFAKLGITVTKHHMDTALALEKIRRGDIAATVLVAGKPAPLVQSLPAEAELHLLPVPFAEPLFDSYLPSRFTAKDYPNLVPPGKAVPAIAVGTVMAIFDWKPNSPRGRKAARFIRAFFSHLSELRQPPRHKKWREVNLAAKVPGWRRFPLAEKILADVMRQPTAAPETAKPEAKSLGKPERKAQSLATQFTAFLKAQGALPENLGPEEQRRLFGKFLEWSRNQRRTN